MNVKIVMALVAVVVGAAPVYAEDGFPFGLEMTLDAAPMAGSKRRPTLEIGDAGETRVELWCGGGSGQFSVAGNTVVFVPRANDTRSCTPAQSQADAALASALAEISAWRRQGDVVTFAGGSTPLRFRINTN